MSVETFSKSLQGQTFRLEVAHVGRPEVVTPSPLVGEPIQIEASVLGFAEETDVEFCIYEPFRIHEDPIETLTAKTAAETRVVAICNAAEPESCEASLRPDLFYRLAAMRIDLPPLRARGEILL